MLVTANLEARGKPKEAESAVTLETLQHISYILYLIQFHKKHRFRALIKSGNMVNTMTSAYVKRLDLTFRKISVGV